MSPKTKIRIRAKIMIPAILLAIVPVVGLMLITNWRLNKAIELNIHSIAQNRFEVLKMNIEQLENEALTVSSMMANLPEIKRGYEASRTDSISINEGALIIENSVDKILNGIEERIGHPLKLHFHILTPGDPKLKSFYRSWSDITFSELDNNRKALKIISRIRKSVKGFEIGKSGMFIRGISPIFSNDEIYFFGTVETLLDTKTLLSRSVITQNDNFALFLNNKNLSENNKKLIPESFVERIGSFSFVEYSSHDFRLSNIESNNLDRMFTTKEEFVSFYKDNYFYAGFPVNDIAGKKIGVVVFQYNTDVFSQQKFVIQTITIGTSFLILVMIILIMVVISSYISRPIRRIHEHVRKLSQGHVIEEISGLPDDEIGEMGEAINQFVVRLRRLVLFAKDISKGQYSSRFEHRHSNDELGANLVEMQEQLMRVETEAKKRKEKDERNNWLSEGRARIGEILRENIDSLEKLSDQLVSFLVKYFNANQGGVFVIGDDDKSQTLTMASAYAYSRKKFLVREFKIGQGLVGVCAFERETIYLTEIPDDYILVQSGLGGTNPTVLILIPLVFNEVLYGVLEMASFNELKEHEIKFLQDVSETIASSLSTVKINAQTNLLLRKYQEQSAEIEKKEIQMQKSMEAMELSKLEANNSEQNLKRYVDTLDRTVMRITVDYAGNIIEMNHTFIEFGGWAREDVMGSHFLDFVIKDERSAVLKKWTEFQNNERGRLDIETRFNIKGSTKWVSGSFSRTFNRKSNKEIFVFIGIDIHNIKRSETIFGNSLNAIKTAVLYTEFNAKGDLLEKTDLFVKALGYNREQLQKLNVFKWFDGDDRSELKKIWVRLGSGYPVYRTEGFLTNFNSKKWFQSSYIPVFDEQGKFSYVLHLASDVTLLKKSVDQIKDVEKVIAGKDEIISDLELELNLSQSRLDKVTKDFDFFREEQTLRLRNEKLEAEQQKEELRKEIVELHIKIDQLELDRNIQKINYEKQIQSLSRFFEEDRKRLNKSIAKLERELSLMKSRRNINF